jgi:hypothetical protein
MLHLRWAFAPWRTWAEVAVEVRTKILTMKNRNAQQVSDQAPVSGSGEKGGILWMTVRGSSNGTPKR